MRIDNIAPRILAKSFILTAHSFIPSVAIATDPRLDGGEVSLNSGQVHFLDTFLNSPPQLLLI